MMRALSDGLQRVVRVGPAELVLDEEAGMHQLADVVVVGADARQQSVGADHIRALLGQVRHDDAVLEGRRRFVLQPQQQRRAELRHLQQLQPRRHAEQRAERDEDAGG